MKGSVLFFVGPENSGTHQALRPIIPGLRERGWTVETQFVTTPRPTPPHGSWDIVHLGYHGFLPAVEDLDCLKTLSLWAPGQWWEQPTETLRSLDRLFVFDNMTAIILARHSLYPTLVPFVWSAADFHVLPAPEGEFTVGTFGNDYRPGSQDGKRFHIIEVACAKANIAYRPALFPAGRTIYEASPIDIYSRIHVLAHARLADTLALPPLEALACGRPILSTRIPALQGYLHEGINGLYFDGSIDDCAEKLTLLRNYYHRFVTSAQLVPPQPPLLAAVNVFDDAFSKLLGVEEPVVQRLDLREAERGTK